MLSHPLLWQGEPTHHLPNPRFFRRDEKALTKAQRRLSACAKGRPEYNKRKRVVQHIHQRIVNRRDDFAHLTNRCLVDAFQHYRL